MTISLDSGTLKSSGEKQDGGGQEMFKKNTILL